MCLQELAVAPERAPALAVFEKRRPLRDRDDGLRLTNVTRAIASAIVLADVSGLTSATISPPTIVMRRSA
jgi:hypothetical protein